MDTHLSLIGVSINHIHFLVDCILLAQIVVLNPFLACIPRFILRNYGIIGVEIQLICVSLVTHGFLWALAIVYMVFAFFYNTPKAYLFEQI